jgi:regulator of RNase E activity RraA
MIGHAGIRIVYDNKAAERSNIEAEAELMKELIEKLRIFTVPELCDGCADPNVMDYRIKPAFGTPHICGRAVTLDIPEGITGKVPDAIMELKEGDILVIAGKGWQKSAYWGDHRSVCAKMLGAEGVIIDGLYRDKEGCEAAGLPVFALGLCARSSLQKQEGQINIPVECAGAAVSPGDIICADQNGVIVIRPEDAENIMAKAAAKRALQEELEQWMKQTGNVVSRIRKPSSLQ